MTRRILRAGRLYDGTGAEALTDQAVVMQEGRILAVLPWSDAPGPADHTADVVTPGLIDLQLNGAGGVQFNDAPSLAGLAQIARGARRGGTAYFLPTFITDRDSRYRQALAVAQSAVGQVPGVLGLHLEGPFLSPRRPGIHPADCIRPLTAEDAAVLEGADLPLLLTLAPEEADPALTTRLAGAGLRLFAGHSEAQPEDFAAHPGVIGATHLFNAMSQMAGRAPGVVGAVLGSDSFFAGLIPDGVHVAPAAMRAALNALGPERLFLVTDAMSPLGTEATEFDLLGKRIYRRDGRLSDQTGTLAGADVAMDQCLQRMVALTGATVAQAVQMATQTPARVMGLEARIGTIAPGKAASLTLLSQELQAEGVLLNGAPADTPRS